MNQDKQQSYWGFIIPLFITVFLAFMDHLIVVPLSAEISTSTGLPLVKSGLLVSIYPFAAAISAFFFAPFSDRLGRKKLLLILTFGFSLATLGCALSNTVFTIFLFRILSGVFAGPVISNILAFAGDTFSGNQRARALTSIMLSFSVASILGVPIGAWLGEHYSWHAPFYFISVLALVCLAMIFRLKEVKTGAESGRVVQQFKEMLLLWKQKPVQIVFLIQFFMLAGLFGYVPNISVWLKVNYQMTPSMIGFCYMQGGVGALIGNLIAGQLLKRGFQISLLNTGSIIMGIFLVITTSEIFPGPYIGVLIAGIMFGGTMRMPAFQLILTEIVPIHIRGRLMSMSMIVSNLSMAFGGVWSIPLLSLEADYLQGMWKIGLIAMISLLFVPLLSFQLVRKTAQLKRAKAKN